MSVCKRVFSGGFGPGLDSMSPAMLWGRMTGFSKILGVRASGEAG